MFRIVWMKDVTALVNEHPGKRFFLPEAVMVAPLRRPQANFMRPTFVWWAGDVRWGKSREQKATLRFLDRYLCIRPWLCAVGPGPANSEFA
ncbi:hypothetical protein [Mesorhizobium sp.]|uniref:hypothetical protein n=1 Tax=Mesorhizobium sp. TaxID=1871066 RepID=UPI0025F9185B|nr:hypothetical protein [Mesorhizobium sp.]